jgi:CHAT domain-containing protein/Tfp pilus assembly protein PilF
MRLSNSVAWMALMVGLGGSAIGLIPTVATAQTNASIVKAADQAADQGNYPEAIRLFEQALAELRRGTDRKMIASTLWRLGTLSQENKEYNKAITYLEEAETITQSLGDPALLKNIRLSQRISRLDLGNSFLQKKQSAKALTTFQKTFEISQRNQDPEGQILSLLKIGEIYRNQQQYSQALQPFQQALTIAQPLPDSSMFNAVLFVLGRTYDDLAQYDKAIALYQEALQRLDKTQDEGTAAMVANNLATIYQQQGLYQQSQPLYDRALATTRKLQPRYQATITLEQIAQICVAPQTDQAPHIKIIKLFCNNKAIPPKALLNNVDSLRSTYFQSLQKLESSIINNLGIITARLGDYATAIKFHEQSVTIAEKLNEPVTLATSWNNLGNLYTNQGEYNQAIDFYQRSLKILQANGARDLEATTLNNLAQIYHHQGDFRQAIALCNQGLAIVKETGNIHQQATILNNLGNHHNSLAEYEQAQALTKQALALYQKVGDREGETTALSNVAIIAEAQGDYDTSIKNQQQALKIAQEIGTKEKEMNITANMGRSYSDQGQYAKAFALYDKALAMSRQLGIPSWEITTLINQAQTYREIGRYDKALALFNQANQQSQKLGEQVSLGFGLVGSAGILLDKGQASQAIAPLQTALKIQQTTGAKRAQIYSLRSLGKLATKTGNPTAGLNTIQQALTMSRELGLPVEAGILLQDIAQIQLDTKQYTEAQTTAQQAVQLSRKTTDRPNEAKSLTILGAALLATNQANPAQTALTEAATIWEATRPGLKDRDKVSLLETQTQTYRLLQRSLVAQNKSDQALEVSERSRARAFVELFAHRIGHASHVPMPKLAEIQAIARQQQATLVQYSMVGDRELYIWVIKPDGQISFRQGNLEASLPQVIQATRNKIGVRSRAAIRPVQVAEVTPSPQGDLKFLHQALIAPIAADLPQDDKQPVIIVPQGALFMVPFAALEDTQGRALIEKHTIAVAPSLQAIALSRSLKNQTNGSGNVIVGNPTMPKLEDFQLDPLPGAEKEAIAIGQLLATKPLIGNAASKPEVIRQMQTAGVVHLATHGLLDTFRGDVPGAIALAPGNNQDGLLTAGEIAEMKLQADLVVLSACSTGKGDITGDGVLGLSRSLFLAGVPSVVVSLWDVDDASTEKLMTEFYRNWQEKKLDKAQALRQAMLTTKQSFREPWHWAAFNLIGEVR